MGTIAACTSALGVVQGAYLIRERVDREVASTPTVPVDSGPQCASVFVGTRQVNPPAGCWAFAGLQSVASFLSPMRRCSTALVIGPRCAPLPVAEECRTTTRCCQLLRRGVC